MTVSGEPFGLRKTSIEQFEIFVRNLIEAFDGAAVLTRELRQPDVGALGDHDDVGHPVLVGAEALVFDVARMARMEVGDFGMGRVGE